MAARKKTKKRKPTGGPPAPIPSPEEIHRRRPRIHKARKRKYPPSVTVLALRRHPLLAPEAGEGWRADLLTSYAVTERELERAIVYGFRYCPPDWTA